MEDPILPERIGRYDIVLQIAKGGMATVYLARSSGIGGFGRYVAVKLTSRALANDPDFATHLIHEANLLAHLRHPNVVTTLDVAESDLGVYLVMEYVPGDSLFGLLKKGREAGEPLPQAVSLRVLHDALLGLHAAHDQESEDGEPLNIVHRDFSPQNIIVGTDGIARLVDFGIAKAASSVSNTQSGTIKGKISYVAPEQARGKKMDRRTDIWSAGVIAWETLAKKKLFKTDNKALLEIIAGDPPRVGTVVPDIHPALDEAIAKALKSDPDERIATAGDFARELGEAARAAGLFADIDEVARHVTRLAGPMLAARKAEIEKVRKEWKKRGESLSMEVAKPLATQVGVPSLEAEIEAEMQSMKDERKKEKESLPSLPDIPLSVTSAIVRDATEEIEVAPASEPHGRVSPAPPAPAPPKPPTPPMKRAQTLVGVAPPPSDRALAAERQHAAPAPQPSSSRLALSPLDAPGNGPPSSRGVLDIAAPIGEPVTEDPNLAMRSPFAVGGPSKLDEARAKASELVSSLTPTQKKIAAAGGAGGFLFLLITVIAVSCGGPSKESAEKAAAAAGSSAGMLLDVPPTTAFTAPTSTVASEPPKEPPRTTGAPFPDGVWPSIVEIVGDAPIAYVKVEGRATDIIAPTPRVNVELEPGEDSHDVHVFAQTNDGRTATGIAKPGGTLNLSFANAPVRPPQPPPPPPQKGWKGRGKK